MDWNHLLWKIRMNTEKVVVLGKIRASEIIPIPSRNGTVDCVVSLANYAN